MTRPTVEVVHDLKEAIMNPYVPKWTFQKLFREGLEIYDEKCTIGLFMTSISGCFPTTPFVKRLQDHINEVLIEQGINSNDVINVQCEEGTGCVYHVKVVYKKWGK